MICSPSSAGDRVLRHVGVRAAAGAGGDDVSVSKPVADGGRRTADVVVSNRLLPLEAATALLQARRLSRIDEAGLSQALVRVDALWEECFPIEIDDALVGRARQCASEMPLRAYDAAHCAAGLLVADEPEAVLVTGDQQLLAAWRHFGATVVDVNEPPE